MTSRVFTVFALAGWTGFHALSAILLAGSGSAPSPVGLLIIAHAALAVVCLWTATGLSHRSDDGYGAAFALLALAGSLVLAGVNAWLSPGGAALGGHAAAVALTLVVLAFARGIELPDEEADDALQAHFMREAGLLGARMGRIERERER